MTPTAAVEQNTTTIDPGNESGLSRDRLNHIQLLEAESIHIFREVASEFQNPVMLYSIGKDSSVMLRLAQKAFYPAPIPFPLLHVDTGYKFREMLEFRDRYTAELGLKLIVWRNEEALADGANPIRLGTQRCCGLLKTQALLDGLRAHGFDAAFGGARRDEEKSRAKERIFSFRDAAGQWDPKNQRPELWNLFNGRIGPGESIRVFPLSNWTELDIWHYIHLEKIPIVPLYFAKPAACSFAATRSSPSSSPSSRACPAKSSGYLPPALARLQPLHRRHPLRSRHRAQDHRGAHGGPQFRARQPHHRPRPGRLHGTEKTRGLLLMATVEQNLLEIIADPGPVRRIRCTHRSTP